MMWFDIVQLHPQTLRSCYSSLVNKYINPTILLMRRNAIVQEDSMGCGIACIAFVLDKTYQETLKLFLNSNNAKGKGFYCKEIVEAFKNAGLSCNYKYIKKKRQRNIYENNSIVYIRKSKRYPAGHYLCRWNNLWMDSWINFPNENKKAGFRERLPGKSIYVIF